MGHGDASRECLDRRSEHTILVVWCGTKDMCVSRIDRVVNGVVTQVCSKTCSVCGVREPETCAVFASWMGHALSAVIAGVKSGVYYIDRSLSFGSRKQVLHTLRTFEASRDKEFDSQHRYRLSYHIHDIIYLGKESCAGSPARHRWTCAASDLQRPL